MEPQKNAKSIPAKPTWLALTLLPGIVGVKEIMYACDYDTIVIQEEEVCAIFQDQKRSDTMLTPSKYFHLII